MITHLWSSENRRRLFAPAAVALALFAISAWLQEPRVEYLAVGGVATVAAFATIRARSTSRWALGIAAIALAAATLIGVRAQLRLYRYSSAPARVGSEEAAARRDLLRERVDRELGDLRHAVTVSMSLPADRIHAFGQLRKAIDDEEHRAIVVTRNDSLIAWSGTLHGDLAQMRGRSGVVASPFGLTLYEAEQQGALRVVAASLLFATSPADRLAKGLAQRMPSDEVTEGFSFAPPTDSATDADLKYMEDGRTIFLARPIVPSLEEVRFRMLERARVRVAVALLFALVAFLIAAARRGGGALAIVGGTLVVLSCIAVIPLSQFSTRSRLFDPAVYFFPPGQSFTSNAAALTVTSAIFLLLVLLGVRRIGARLPRIVAIAIAAATTVGGPFAVRSLSQGIALPSDGAGFELWLAWSIPLCLAATALLVLAHWAGRRTFSSGRGLPIMTAPAVASIAAVLAPILWEAPGQWPQWYWGVWALAVASLVLARPSRRALRACSMVAALAATSVVWGSASHGRVELAERDVRGLSQPDAYGIALGGRLAASMQGEELPRSPEGLLERYVTSDLASAGYQVGLLSWQGTQPVASIGTGPLDVAYDTVGVIADAAQASQRRISGATRAGVYGVAVIAVPMRGGAVTIIVAPRSRLVLADAYSRWFGLASRESNEPPYSLQVVNDPVPARDRIDWRRVGEELHGDWRVAGPSQPVRVHVEVDLRGLDALVPRGGLLVIVNMLVVSLVWVLAAIGDGRIARWLRMRRRQIESYRARLSVALVLFFLVPAAVFGVWSWRQLVDDSLASRRLLVTETMRAFGGDPNKPDALIREAARLNTKLLLYQSGVLVAASDSVFADLAPMGKLLRPEVALTLDGGHENGATRPEVLDGAQGMLGYRVLNSQGQLILAAPARVDDFLLDRRRRDLGVLVLFATALGGFAALWLSGIAARQLARPIGALREAARAIARGESHVELREHAVREFLPVFSAFRAMARDLGESRSALVEAQRRTDAVLRTVASGVIAVDETGRVILSNPRAEALLGDVPEAGAPINALSSAPVAARVAGFLRGDQARDDFEFEREGRTLRGQLTRLSRGGVVVTCNDVTELARAQRVLAWGEMARQVAHEIKNPLTPIRLGVQHLLRAKGRADFDAILEQNVSRILDEIDRLDEIAKAFSRYGGAPAERAPAEATDVASIVQDVVALEKLGESSVEWSCEVTGEVPWAFARGDELREVLLNVFENARHAHAKRVATTVCVVGTPAPSVRVEVVDDGAGIAADVLPKIFEPHFSTRTSGSGLGLAITRRLVESWGGSVSISSSEGSGSVVRIDLRGA